LNTELVFAETCTLLGQRIVSVCFILHRSHFQLTSYRPENMQSCVLIIFYIFLVQNLQLF